MHATTRVVVLEANKCMVVDVAPDSVLTIERRPPAKVIKTVCRSLAETPAHPGTRYALLHQVALECSAATGVGPWVRHVQAFWQRMLTAQYACGGVSAALDLWVLLRAVVRAFASDRRAWLQALTATDGSTGSTRSSPVLSAVIAQLRLQQTQTAAEPSLRLRPEHGVLVATFLDTAPTHDRREFSNLLDTCALDVVRHVPQLLTAEPYATLAAHYQRSSFGLMERALMRREGDMGTQVLAVLELVTALSVAEAIHSEARSAALYLFSTAWQTEQVDVCQVDVAVKRSMQTVWATLAQPALAQHMRQPAAAAAAMELLEATRGSNSSAAAVLPLLVGTVDGQPWNAHVSEHFAEHVMELVKEQQGACAHCVAALLAPAVVTCLYRAHVRWSPSVDAWGSEFPQRALGMVALSVVPPSVRHALCAAWEADNPPHVRQPADEQLLAELCRKPVPAPALAACTGATLLGFRRAWEAWATWLQELDQQHRQERHEEAGVCTCALTRAQRVAAGRLLAAPGVLAAVAQLMHPE